MNLLVRGHDEALSTLIDRWRAQVWTFIDRLCGRLGRTDDIFQDVWTRVYLYRKKYDPTRTTSFKSYLFAIVVNCCRTSMSKRLGEPVDRVQSESPAQTGLPSNAPEPLDALISNEQYDQVRRSVDRLPDQQRTVVLLYLLYDSDYRTIADALGLRQGTVRSHMSLALKNLRRFLVRTSPADQPAPEGQVHYE